jgi:hypothetical protein
MENLKVILKNKNKMKTNIIIVLAFLAMNLNIALAAKSFAINFDQPLEFQLNSSIVDLAPVPPKEAYFNDIVPEPSANISILGPTTPKEATFDEELDCGIVMCKDMLKSLAPVSPKEADFDNSSVNSGNDRNRLLPEPTRMTAN